MTGGDCLWAIAALYLSEGDEQVNLKQTRFARVRHLFEKAIELPPEAQGIFLDRECRGEPRLRREIYRLLIMDRSDANASTDRVGSTVAHAIRSFIACYDKRRDA